MNSITFFKTQLDLALFLNTLIDSYWAGEISESEFINKVIYIIENNKEKIFKNNGFTKVVQQRCGVRRLDLVNKVINNSNIKLATKI